MAVYRLGDMIRMRREALGLTQSQFIQIYTGTETGEKFTGCTEVSCPSYCGSDRNISSEAPGKTNNEICSVQALHRIENGGVKRVKFDVFRRLMEKMGLLPERTYASLLVTECRGLRLKTEIHAHMNMGEYEEAERKLQQLEMVLVPDYPRNEQYRMALKAKLAYKKEKTGAEKYLTALLDALRYTVPKLDEIDIAGWPFNMNEFDILVEILNAYHAVKDREKELEFLLQLKKNSEKKYMEEDHYVMRHMVALTGLSQLMCMTGQHAKSVEYCKIGIEECKNQKILGNVSRFLFDIAWNIENQMRMGIYPNAEASEHQGTSIEKERTLCKKQLVQAYYLSTAQGDSAGAKRIKTLYEYFYPDAVKLLE